MLYVNMYDFIYCEYVIGYNSQPDLLCVFSVFFACLADRFGKSHDVKQTN